MIIAVNTRLLKPFQMEGIGVFTHQVLLKLIQRFPEHEFHLIYDHSNFSVIGEHPNVQHHRVFPPARRPWLFDWWFDYSLPRLLRKIKADIFISPDGHGSLRCPCPQLTVIHDLNFVHFPQYLPRKYARYWNRHTPAVVRVSDRIATVSEFSKQDLIHTYSLSADQIDVLCNGYSEGWKPLSENEKTSARNHFANGRRYWVYVGSIHPRKNVQGMLAAFDQFCQQSASDIDLVLVGTPLFENSAAKQWTSGLRNAHRVHWTGRLEGTSLHQAMAGSEGLLLLSHYEGFGIPVVEAFACGVPVLTANNSALEEIGGDVVFYANNHSVEDMAEKMNELAFNEIQREKCVAGGLQRKENYTWDKASEALWESILKTIADAQGTME